MNFLTPSLRPATGSSRPALHEEIHRRLKDYPTVVFSKVRHDLVDGQLTLSGSVPSFYLRQVLQERLRSLPGVDSIVIEVDVVSSSGLSSVR